MEVLVCCILLILSSSATYASRFHITNGENAKEGEFPFAVSIRIAETGVHSCGGTILNENFVLTAAHCFCDEATPLDPALFDVQYGVLNVTVEPVNVVGVSAISCHNFSTATTLFDCAILKLKRPLPTDGSDNWRPATISKDFDTSKEQKGVIIGWGYFTEFGPSAVTLQKLNVTIYDDEVCGRKYNTAHHICFGSDSGSACYGDSGGALMVDGIQVGICSRKTGPCGVANERHPNVYSRVATYYDWIESIVGDLA